MLEHGRFLLRVSFVQLYRESLSDLLAPDGGNLSIREDPHKGVFVEGVTEVAVRAPQDVWALAARGQRARTTAATRINDVSSRSHALFTVVLEQVMTPGGGTPPRDAPTGDAPTGDAPTGDAPTGDGPAHDGPAHRLAPLASPEPSPPEASPEASGQRGPHLEAHEQEQV